jgi:hypothetical protein
MTSHEPQGSPLQRCFCDSLSARLVVCQRIRFCLPRGAPQRIQLREGANAGQHTPTLLYVPWYTCILKYVHLLYSQAKARSLHWDNNHCSLPVATSGRCGRAVPSARIRRTENTKIRKYHGTRVPVWVHVYVRTYVPRGTMVRTYTCTMVLA